MLKEELQISIRRLKYARSRLEAHQAGDIALAVIDGIIEGDQFTLDVLENAWLETRDHTPNESNCDLLKQAALTGVNQ